MLKKLPLYSRDGKSWVEKRNRWEGLQLRPAAAPSVCAKVVLIIHS